MNLDFAAALRRALQLTRAQDIAGATRVIQTALSRGEAVDAGRHSGPDDITAPQPPKHSTPSLIDPRAEIVEPSPSPESSFEISRRGVKALNAAFPGAHLRRPLGEVLARLREGKARIGSLDWPAARTRRQPPPIPEGARFLERSFACAAGTRSYKLYIPASAPERPLGLVVMLHGCKQDPDDFAAGTNMNALAEQYGVLVAYPRQPNSANASCCWNWFRPTDQMRDAGEPSIIAGLTREIISEFGLDRERVFVAGLSAGGAMAAVMSETYPDLYAAVGIHSGLAYGSANDVVSAFAAMRGESGAVRPAKPAARSARPGIRTIVFQGSADAIVHPSNAERIIAAGRSQVAAGHAWEESGASTGGRSYTRAVLRGPEGDPVLEYWLIAGAGHAWSGGHREGSYADPSGPEASAEMMRFFFAPLPAQTP
jgi:poly(hydroxyalkanoate) depolymerase family esterase